MGLMDSLKGMLGKSKAKGSDAAEAGTSGAGDLVAKARDAATKIDDKAEDLAEKDGTLGTVAGKAHEVLDKVDGD
jgi:hypothetical protein